MDNLNLVSTQDLITELENRHDNIVVVGMKNLGKGNYFTINRYKGDKHYCVAMCEKIKIRLVGEIIRYENPTPIENIKDF